MPRTAADAAVGIAAMSRTLTDPATAQRPCGVAQVAKRELLTTIAPATGGDLRLSGVGRNGARIGVRYRIVGGTAEVAATGPLHFLEGGTQAHDVEPRRRRAVYGAGMDRPLARVHVRGAPAKRVWSRAVGRAAPVTTRTYAERSRPPRRRLPESLTMANYTDRLLLVVDAATKAAQNQLGQLQGSLAKTDSAAETSTKATGKLAQGWDMVKSSGLLAGVSVAAAGKIILDSVGDWTRLGKAVTDASLALGVGTEEASRWIAVADDYEIGADQITGALLRVEKAAAAPAPLKELGIR
jgi:hypothetical protein